MSRFYFPAATLRMGGVALLCVMCWRSSFGAPTAQQKLAVANNNFTFNLLQQVVTADPGSNIFISAYSAATALQMVSIGAAGSTKDEMDEALCATNLSPTALNVGNKGLYATINCKDTNYLLTTANAIWYRKGLTLETPFLEVNRAFFKATVTGLDFTAQSSVDAINNWAAKETHGKITNIVEGPIPAEVQLFLNNAVYFLGNWQTKFDTNLTTPEPFSLEGGGQETVPTMHLDGTLSYLQGPNFQAVRLPYSGSNLAMYVFLPDSTNTAPSLLSSMNGAWWQQILKTQFDSGDVALALPKFKLNFSASLVPELEALGIELAFTPEADFAKLSDEPLYISDVAQQAVVDVNESGTEAAAVTTITVVTGVVTPTMQINVDRPFLFFINDERAGSILFSGLVLQP